MNPPSKLTGVPAWLYFGCDQQPGHRVFGEGMNVYSHLHNSYLRQLMCFDRKLPPQDDRTPYIATVSRLEDWGLTALAFWDYSVDKRGGSNSVVFAPSLEIGPEELLVEAQARFPEVFERLPQKVQLMKGLRRAQPVDASGTPKPAATLLEQQAVQLLNAVKASPQFDRLHIDLRIGIDAVLMMAEQRRTKLTPGRRS